MSLVSQTNKFDWLVIWFIDRSNLVDNYSSTMDNNLEVIGERLGQWYGSGRNMEMNWTWHGHDW